MSEPIITNWQALFVLSGFLLTKLFEPNRRELILSFILSLLVFQTVLYKTYIYLETEWFFILNVSIVGLLVSQSHRIAKRGQIMPFMPLFLFLVLHMLLNSYGLLDYVYQDSQHAGFITQGNEVLTALELMGLTLVTFNGLSQFSGRVSESVLSGLYRLVSYLYSISFNSSYLSRG